MPVVNRRARPREEQLASPAPIGPVSHAALSSMASYEDDAFTPSTEDMRDLVADLRRAGAEANAASLGGAGGPLGGGGGGASTRRSYDCSPSALGLVVGHSGMRIREMEARTGAWIKAVSNLRTPHGARVIVEGPEEAVDLAGEFVAQSLALAQSPQRVEVPRASLGRIIGRNGERIKGIIERSGARCQVQQEWDPCYVTISSEDPMKLQVAREMISGYLDGSGARPWAVAEAAHRSAAAAVRAQEIYASLPSPLDPAAVAALAPVTQAAGGVPGDIVDPYKNADLAWASAADGTGRVYYYNTMTGQSQWEKPPHL